MGKDLLRDSLDKLSIEYDEDKILKLISFYEMLSDKNKVMNLTAITDYDDVIIKHYIDSLSVLKYISIDNEMNIADLGTGAGFPGVPLAVFFQKGNFVLIDSVNKKLSFINDAVKKLDLNNIITVHARAEDISHMIQHRERYDIVLSRAVSNMSSLVELAFGLVKLGGIFVAYKSENTDEEINAARHAIRLMGGEVDIDESITLPNSEIRRRIIIIKKISSTPKQYPRKAGEPSKNPIIKSFM